MKAVVVISFDHDEQVDGEQFFDIVEAVRDIFAAKPGVGVHLAIRESANKVLATFEEGPPTT